jgi:hypothetical protein
MPKKPVAAWRPECRPRMRRAGPQRRQVGGNSQVRKTKVFPLCYATWTLKEKSVMHATRFAFTSTQLLVGGYMFGACILVAHAQAQQQVAPPPPSPTAPVINPPSPNGAAPQPAPVSPAAPNEAPGSGVTSPVNEPGSAARTHERKSVAKPVHHRGRSTVAGRTLPFYWRLYWDPRVPCCCCPIWNPYGPDYGGGWLMSRF